MDQKVIWSARAETSLGNLLNYLKENFGEAYAANYLGALQLKIRRLASYPTMGILSSKRSNSRRLVLDKHNYLVYAIVEERIVIHNIAAYKLQRRDF